MSDTQQAPDWWLASDGKWYPPQGTDQPLTPSPQESRSQARLRKGQAKLRTNVQPFLEPGEQLQAVFVSQTGPSPGHIGLASNLQRYWMVAVTDRNILVCPMGVKGAVTRLQRAAIEMPDMPSHSSSFPVTIGETRHWVAREQFEVVSAANEILRAGSTPGAPEQDAAAAQAAWYPDPTRRHELRYWDGRSWSANVSDQGTQSTDPI
jgi:hypothetical protein